MNLTFGRRKLFTVTAWFVLVAILIRSPTTGAFAPIHKDNSSSMRSATKENQTVEEPFERITWNPLRLLVLKLGFTEPRFSSPLNYGEKDGIFKCAYCGLELFDSSGKYDSGSGWPSFWRSIKDGHVSYQMEWDGRLECKCGRCSSHLGHVFLDGPSPAKVPKEVYEASPPSDPRGKNPNGYLPRFCVNGASLTFDKRD